LTAYEKRYKYKEYVVMQLGDDNVIFVRSLAEFNLPRFVEFCKHLGHKLEAVHRPDPDYAEFCSQRFWNIGSQYVLGPKPGRVLSKSFICHDTALRSEDMPGYITGIARGFKHYNWIPVLGTFCANLITKNAPLTRRAESSLARAANPYKVFLRSELTIDKGSVHAQFSKIYGFDPNVIEATIQDMKIVTGKAWYNESLRHMAQVDGGYDPDACYEFLCHG